MAAEKRKSEAVGEEDLEGSFDSDTSDFDEGNATTSTLLHVPAATASTSKPTKKVGKLAKKNISVTSPILSDVDEEGGGTAAGKEARVGGDRARDDEDEEERSEVELGKHQSMDPDKMQAILANFTAEQMSRYECYRRSGFQRANMRRLLQSVAGCPISIPTTIVMSGIAKMFVGELVELGRITMAKRKESGPIRPRHIREAYRRLKLEGKVPSRSRKTLFH